MPEAKSPAELNAVSEAGGSRRIFAALAFLATAIYLFLNLFTWRGVPLYNPGDQIFFWQFALRMSQGDHAYRDFFQFTPPGTDLLYLGLLKLFGPFVWLTEAATLLLGLVLFCLFLSVFRRLLEERQAVIATVVVMILVVGDRLDGTHHWFSFALALYASRILMPARTYARIAFAGICVGLAACFTQTAGFASWLALSVALLWEYLACHRINGRMAAARVLLLSFAAAATWIMLMGWFLADAGWRTVWYQLITYPRLYVQEGAGFLLPNIRYLMNLHQIPLLGRRLFVYALCVVYPCALWRCWKARRELDQTETMQLVLLALTGGMLMLEVATRTSWLRIDCVVAPAVMLSAFYFTRVAESRFKKSLSTLGAVLLALIAAGQIYGQQKQVWGVAQLPAGAMALPRLQYETYTWLAEHVPPGEYLLEGNWLDVFLPLRLRNPVFAEGMRYGETSRPEFVERAVRELEQRHVKYVLWTPSLQDPRPESLGTQDSPSADHVAPLREELHTHFVRVHTFSDGKEFWERP